MLLLISVLCLVSYSSAVSHELLTSLQNEKIEVFKVQLQHTLEGARIRRKRQIGMLNTLSDPAGLASEHLRIGSSIPEDIPYFAQYNLTTWVNFQHMKRYYVFIGTSYGGLGVLDVTDTAKFAKVVAFTANEQVVKKARAFTYFDEQWFVVHQTTDVNSKIQLYLRIGRALEPRQSIILPGKVDFDIIKVHGILFLVVINHEDGLSNAGNVMIYRWMHTQFDFITSKPTESAQSIACWAVDGTLFIAVAQEMDMDLSLHSLVFIFDTKDNLILQEKLSVTGPQKVAYFFVSGSHYLIFVGASDAKIFWLSSGQFLTWQSIPGTARATDVSVLALANGEVILVIIVDEEALFLTLDSDGHYIISFTMKLGRFNIKSLQFIYDGKDYYALALPGASMKIQHPIWRLNLEKYDIPEVTSIDPLIQCLSELKEKAIQRKNELDVLQSDLGRVWLTNKEQIIVAPVSIEGAVSASRVIIDEVVISSNETITVTPTEVHSLLLHLGKSGEYINNEVSSVVYKTRPQKIMGIKTFTSSIKVPTLNIRSSNQEFCINNITTSKLAVETLKKTGNQILSGFVQMNQITADKVNTNLLNGVNPNDLVLLNGQQRLSCVLSFSNVDGSDVEVDTINNIHVSNLVLKTKDQTISELKRLKFLNTSSINVKEQTNGLYLNEISNKIITLDTYQEIKGHYEFQSTTEFDEDVFVDGYINHDVNLSKLDTLAVKNNKTQKLTGQKTFVTSVNVFGDVKANGLINGIDLNKLFTISSEQVIESNISAKSIAFNDHLLIDTINNLDFNKDFVKRGDENSVSGLKKFSCSLFANTIEVLDFVTINGIDISASADLMIKHNKGTIKSENCAFQDILVLGNITVSSGINGFEVSDLPQTTWLKSGKQEIGIVSVPDIVLKDIDVQEVNGVDINAGLVHVNDEQVINAEKIFTHNISILNTASISDGKLLDNLDLTSLKEENTSFINFKADDFISGVKIFRELELNRPLNTANVNSLDVTKDFLLVDGQQSIGGTKTFKTLTMVKDKINAKDINVSKVNGHDIKSFFDSAILKQNSSQLIVNKKFSCLKANDISLSAAGKIAGVSIVDMMLRTVTLDSPQYVPASKYYENSILCLNPMLVKIVNSLNFNQLMNKVVLVDNKIITGQKTFIGSNSIMNLTADNVNGFNLIAMERNRMSKSKTNHINSVMFFGDDMDIGELKMQPLSLLDNISLSSVVSIKSGQMEYPTWVLSNMNINGDIFVTGLTNGCDLTAINDHGLRIKGVAEQVISSETHLDSLSIQGNVYFKNTLNEISLEKLQENLIGDGRYHFLAGNFHIQPGVAATRIDVQGTVNGLNLTHLLIDALTASTSQVVAGFKRFKQDLEIEVLTGKSDLTVQTSFNNVDMLKLLEKTVYKNKFQEVEGDKVYGNFRAKNLTIYGYLNGIRFPEDVILTSVSEYIHSPVVFMNNIHIVGDLQVDGKISGIQLDSIADNLVSLNKDEDVLSDLTFMDDATIKGSFNVDGLINDILLGMVVHTKGNSQVDGFKSFFNNLIVIGDIYASSINRKDISQLTTSIVRHNLDEALENTQVFVRPIYTEDELTVNYVNNVSLPSIATNFLENSGKISYSMNFLNNLSSSHDKDLTYQLDYLPYQVTSFAYFIVVQELHFKTSNRILKSFQPTYKSMYEDSLVVWVTENICSQGLCCDVEYSYWMNADEYGLVSIESEPKQGKYFPLPTSLINTDDLIVWTNTSAQPVCGEVAYEETVIGSLHKNYTLGSSHIIRNSPILVDVRMFKDGLTYIIAAYSYDKRNEQYGAVIVYRGNEIKQDWAEYQVLPMYGVLSMDLAVYQRKDIMLVLGTGFGTYPDSYSAVYRWNETMRIFDLLQNIPSQYARSVHWIHRDTHLLLAVSGLDKFESMGSNCMSLMEGGQIDIYSYGNYGLILIQTLRLPGVISMLSFEIKGETYLVAASETLQSITIFQWQGYSKFVPFQVMEAPGVTHLNYFLRSNDLYLTVTSNIKPIKILKAVIRGNRFKSFSYSDERTSSELSDDPVHKIKSTC